MVSDIHVTIEKKSAYGWSLATMPEPCIAWAIGVPALAVAQGMEKARSYLKVHKPSSVWDCVPVPQDLSTFIHFLNDNLTPEEGAILFGDEPWFEWSAGTPEVFEASNDFLYAVLANYQNSYGIPPISRPRALPPDVTSDTMSLSILWNNSAHLKSHVSLAELQAYPWKSSVRINCWIDEDEYIQLKQAGTGNPTGRPSKFLPFARVPTSHRVTDTEMDAILAGTRPRLPGDYAVSWSFFDTVENLVGAAQLQEMINTLAGG